MFFHSSVFFQECYTLLHQIIHYFCGVFTRLNLLLKNYLYIYMSLSSDWYLIEQLASLNALYRILLSVLPNLSSNLELLELLLK